MNTTFLQFFTTENAALQFMRLRNRAAAAAGNRRDVLCVTPGRDDNFAVTDIRTAIELGNGYKWEV